MGWSREWRGQPPLRLPVHKVFYIGRSIVITVGLTAIVSSAGSSASSSASSASSSVLSLLSPVGLGVGGVFVAAALILLLAYFDILNATDDADASLLQTLIATTIPLAAAFAAVIIFHTLRVL